MAQMNPDGRRAVLTMDGEAREAGRERTEAADESAWLIGASVPCLPLDSSGPSVASPFLQSGHDFDSTCNARGLAADSVVDPGACGVREGSGGGGGDGAAAG